MIGKEKDKTNHCRSVGVVEPANDKEDKDNRSVSSSSASFTFSEFEDSEQSIENSNGELNDNKEKRSSEASQIQTEVEAVKGKEGINMDTNMDMNMNGDNSHNDNPAGFSNTNIHLSSTKIDPAFAMSVCEHLIGLYNSKNIADISIACGNQSFDLHSVVLSHGSGYFQEAISALDKQADQMEQKLNKHQNQNHADTDADADADADANNSHVDCCNLETWVI